LINPVAVIETVVGAYGVPESLMTHCNSPEFSEPRHTAMYLLRECTRLSYPAIGRLFGFHHTTVLYGVRQTQRRMKQDLEFKAAVNRLALQFKPSPKQEAMVQV
jgi:chromosomal replication initiator protein